LSEAIKKRQISEELLNGFSDESLEEQAPSLESKLEQLKVCVDKLIVDLRNKYFLIGLTLFVLKMISKSILH